jgi:hypothetical protein
VNFGLADEATTRELPEVDTALSWKNLTRWHDPKTTSNKEQLKLEFNSSKLGDSRKDPEVWIGELEII